MKLPCKLYEYVFYELWVTPFYSIHHQQDAALVIVSIAHFEMVLFKIGQMILKFLNLKKFKISIYKLQRG